MVRRSILFVLPSFDIGGTTVSTRNLISVLDKEKYDITVWALTGNGILRWMYEGVSLLNTSFIIRSLVLRGWKEEHGFFRKITAAVIRKLSHTSSFRRLIIEKSIDKCIGKKKYDIVVACQEGFTSSFVSHIDCDNHIAWVRCDYLRYFEIRNNIPEPFYKKYNHIVCVSETTYNNFLKIYPNYKNKTVCIYNPQDSKLITEQADIDDKDGRFIPESPNVIVSVGRLSSVKRFAEIPYIAKHLMEKNIDFHWYIIGEGEEWEAIADNIKKYGMEERVIMLGAKSNPHFYIKRAILYVCLSSSEACPRVINEAKILGTPVVSTDFPTAYEYLEDGVNGRIVPLDGMSEAISEMLVDKQLYLRVKNEIADFSFDNAPLISQLEAIL